MSHLRSHHIPRLAAPLIAIAFAIAIALLFTPTSAHAAALTSSSVASSGCGAARVPIKPGTTVEQSINVNGLVRTYRLHLPTHYSPNRPSALVLAFHGHGESAGAFERVTGFSRLANARNFIVVYPQGAVGPDGQTGWNTGRRSGPVVDPATDDLGFVYTLVAHLEATLLCINPARIYATGFSNGGGFTGLLACQSGSPFAAAGIMSGDYVDALTTDCAPGRSVPLVEIHGTGDRINPYNGSAIKGEVSATAFLDGWVARNRCANAPQVSSKRGVSTIRWTGCAGGSIVLHYRLTGIGHTWPNTRRFNASSAIWTFFTQE